MKLWVTDRFENYKGPIDAILSCIDTREVNGENALELVCLTALDKGDRIVWKDLRGRWRENIIDGITEERAQAGIVYTYYCPNAAQIELSGDYLEDKRPLNTSAYNAMTSALSSSRWSVGSIADLGQNGTNFYHTNAWVAIHDVADTWGGELEFEITVSGNQITERQIHLRKRVGGDNGKRFTYTKDLVSVRREVEEGNVITALYGYGKALEKTNDEGEATGGYSRKLTFGDVNKGQNWVGDNDALARWGRPDGKGGKTHVFGDVEFDKCEDKNELLALTKKALQNRCTPTVSYEVDAISLARAGEGFEGADEGDIVVIVDKVYNPPLRLQARITKVEEDQLVEGRATYTIGNYQNVGSLIASQTKALSRIESSAGAWDSAASLSNGYINALINTLNNTMNQVGGYTYYEPGEGIITYDKPKDQNPTMAIQIKGAGFRIASSKKSNGEWDWRTFGTGDGFTADEINAGTMKADRIRTGLLTDEAGKNYWDLNTGEFALSAASTVGGKTVSDIASEGDARTLADAKAHANTAASNAQKAAKEAAEAADAQKLADAKAYASEQAEAARSAAEQTARESDTQNLAAAKTYTDDAALATKKASDAAAKAYVDALDEALGQKSVFDRLTNYGATKGIYMENGDLFINADYLKSGVIDAALVKAGVISDEAGKNYWDLNTGKMVLEGGTIKSNNIEGSSFKITTPTGATLDIDANGAKIEIKDGAKHLRIEPYEMLVEDTDTEQKYKVSPYGITIDSGTAKMWNWNTPGQIRISTDKGIFGDAGGSCISLRDTENNKFAGCAIFTKGSFVNDFEFKGVGSGSEYLQFESLWGTFGITIWKSDRRDKEQIKDSETNATEMVRQIKHRAFKFRDVVDRNGNKRSGAAVDCGYIAQELEDIDPSFVFTVGTRAEGGGMQISENAIIPILSKAIQEMDARITTLEEIENMKRMKDSSNGNA